MGSQESVFSFENGCARAAMQNSDSVKACLGLLVCTQTKNVIWTILTYVQSPLENSKISFEWQEIELAVEQTCREAFVCFELDSMNKIRKICTVIDEE